MREAKPIDISGLSAWRRASDRGSIFAAREQIDAPGNALCPASDTIPMIPPLYGRGEISSRAAPGDTLRIGSSVYVRIVIVRGWHYCEEK